MPAPLALHVLIATDGSAEANDAVRRARVLLNPAVVGSITVLSVINPVRAVAAYAELSPGVWNELDRASHDASQRALAEAKTILDGVTAKVEEMRAEGDPATEILRVAREQNAGLIVIGSRGWGGVRSVLMGSVSDRVLHGAHCAVLVVRPDEHDRG